MFKFAASNPSEGFRSWTGWTGVGNGINSSHWPLIRSTHVAAGEHVVFCPTPADPDVGYERRMREEKRDVCMTERQAGAAYTVLKCSSCFSFSLSLLLLLLMQRKQTQADRENEQPVLVQRDSRNSSLFVSQSIHSLFPIHIRNYVACEVHEEQKIYKNIIQFPLTGSGNES